MAAAAGLRGKAVESRQRLCQTHCGEPKYVECEGKAVAARFRKGLFASYQYATPIIRRTLLIHHVHHANS